MCKIVRFCFFAAVLGAVAPSVVARDSVFVIAQKGKRIQLDGFLPEWNPEQARTWGDTTALHWDAVRTPEGIAGYFRFARTQACSSWTFAFLTAQGGRSFEVSSDGEGGEWYQAYLWEDDPQGMISVEWNMRWEQMRSGGGDTASVSLAATSVCGDTLEPFVLAATQEAEAPRRVLNSRIMTQLFFVVVLLALYLWLRVKARRYQKRKG